MTGNKPLKGIKDYLDVLRILGQSTDDFLFLFDIKENKNYFFASSCDDFDININDGFSTSPEQIQKFVHPSDWDELKNEFAKLINGHSDSLNMECRWIKRNGQSIWLSCRGKLVKNENGKPYVIIGRFSEEALRHLYNPLTGLFNQIKLLSDLKSDLENSTHKFLMIVDIDDLSAINLSHGRSYGDKLLKHLAHKLEELSSRGNVYHAERNFFAVCLDVISQKEVEDIYNSLSLAMNDKCTLTAGSVPMDKTLFDHADKLFDSAKIILRKAKLRGKNNIKFYSEEIVNQKVSSVELLEELHESVSNDFTGFFLNYQPQVRAGNYTLYSAEALLRYKSKSGELIYPNDFIPLLEQSKLIVDVGMWVLKTALMQCREWRKSISDMRVSVNFSIVQLREENIADMVKDVLQKTKMPGSALTAEITESIPMSDTEHIIKVLRQFKASGIQIAIDDFGTGYSNLAYLKQLEIDEIKIDRMFVKDIEEDTYNFRLVSNTLDFAKANFIRVCCEGVETTRELAVLESRSPDLIQGYLFDKPCTVDEFKESYIDVASEKFKKRVDFIHELYKFKGDTGVISFDPKEILRATDVGLWMIRIHEESGYCEMYADDTMERIMAVDKKYTPEQCYDYWYSRINKDYISYVQGNVRHMTEIDKVIQLQYPWNHPVLGEVTVRCNGRRVKDSDGMIVLEGYHRILSNIEEV